MVSKTGDCLELSQSVAAGGRRTNCRNYGDLRMCQRQRYEGRGLPLKRIIRSSEYYSRHKGLTIIKDVECTHTRKQHPLKSRAQFTPSILYTCFGLFDYNKWNNNFVRSLN